MPTSSMILLGFISLFGFGAFGAYLWSQRILSPRRACALCVLLSALAFAWLWRRDVVSLRALKELIPIPDVVDATTALSHQELETIASVMQASPIGPRFGTREEIQEVARGLRGQKNPIGTWIIVTPLSAPAVSDFYQSTAHGAGWEVVANRVGCCLLLHHQPYDLLVSYGPDRGGKGTQVVYSLSLDERKN